MAVRAAWALNSSSAAITNSTYVSVSRRSTGSVSNCCVVIDALLAFPTAASPMSDHAACPPPAARASASLLRMGALTAGFRRLRSWGESRL